MAKRDRSSKIRPRCEIIVQYVLPAIRAEMAVRMKNEGISQAQIARILGVTPAAVTQYVKSKRGTAGQDAEVLEVIDNYLDEYKDDPEALSVHLCDVCNEIKSLIEKRENEAAIDVGCCS
ncbi:MAG: transcriptional regulator [Halobacteriota archaeon]